MIGLLKEIMDKRRLIWDLSKSDFRKRFVGSYFGVVWMFIQPMVTVLIYYFVFDLGFRAQVPIPSDVPYVLWLVAGIVPWFFFSEALNVGTGVLQEYHYLVKKVVFNVEILPVVKLASSLIVHGIFVLIMLVLYLLFGRMPSPYWIQIVYYSFCTSALALALSYLTSAVNVFFKDMSQIVSICLQFGMWLTPIMWHPIQFQDRLPQMESIIRFNPMYYIAVGYRDSMIDGNWFWQRPGLTLYFWGVVLVLFLLGIRAFRRLRPHFSDVL